MNSVRQGIYIEIKKGMIGTGSTARPTEYRNFYLVRPSGDMLETVLLTDKLGPTGIIERIPMARFDPAWRHEPRLDKYFAAISAKVAQKPAPKADAPAPTPAPKPQPAATAPKPKQAPAKEADSEKPWWESGGADGKKLF